MTRHRTVDVDNIASRASKAAEDAPKANKANAAGAAAAAAEASGDMSARIESLKSVLGSLERNFKENLHIKRLQHQPQSVFLSDGSALGGLSGESDSPEDLISKARGELSRLEINKTKAADLKAQRDLEEAKLLKQKIEETRESFRHKQALTAAGPKFRRNFYSFFGDVRHVEMLDEGFSFAVFSSKGTIEIWECARDYDDARIISMINLELGPLGIITKIFEENNSPRSD
ncbi:hypothetical protein BC829DRAFT_232268 [Chytridium lagenaria]|nr:hypothetical protein BC829DRAFT_232268 [Chytridium lagenaria]